MNLTEARRRARRGAKFLDKTLPYKWARRVRLTELDMAVPDYVDEGCGCVLAQLYGTYEEAIVEIDGAIVDYEEQDRLGFYYMESYEGTTEDYEPLTEAWKDEIRKRRVPRG